MNPPGKPSPAFQQYYNTLPSSDPVSFSDMQKRQHIQKLSQGNNFNAKEFFANQQQNTSQQTFQQYSNFTPPQNPQQAYFQQLQQQQHFWVPDRKQPFVPKSIIQVANFEHKNSSSGCLCDLVCNQNDCRQLSKVCCVECAPHIHPNHTLENVEQFFSRHREKLKRKDGVHKTHLHEIQQVIHNSRRKRMKQWKWLIKTIRKVERECRSIEDFSLKKIDCQLSCQSRKEAIQRLTTLMTKCKNIKLDSLIQQNPEIFQIKEEYNFDSGVGEIATKEIQNISDQLFLADEKDKERNGSPAPGYVTQALRRISEKWDEMMHKNMGAHKRFSKKMLKETRMSVEESNNIQCIEVKLASEKQQNQQLPPVIQVLILGENILITVHPNLIQLWSYNSQSNK